MVRRRRHYIADQRAEVLAGLAAFVLGAMLLHDAYEGRGRDQPRVMRPFSFW